MTWDQLHWPCAQAMGSRSGFRGQTCVVVMVAHQFCLVQDAHEKPLPGLKVTLGHRGPFRKVAEGLGPSVSLLSACPCSVPVCVPVN